MEPARDGRDDGALDGLGDALPGAAMEPARDGRDDGGWPGSMWSQNMPQWSPPVTGGTTLSTTALER